MLSSIIIKIEFNNPQKSLLELVTSDWMVIIIFFSGCGGARTHLTCLGKVRDVTCLLSQPLWRSNGRLLSPPEFNSLPCPTDYLTARDTTTDGMENLSGGYFLIFLSFLRNEMSLVLVYGVLIT